MGRIVKARLLTKFYKWEYQEIEVRRVEKEVSQNIPCLKRLMNLFWRLLRDTIQNTLIKLKETTVNSVVLAQARRMLQTLNKRI